MGGNKRKWSNEAIAFNDKMQINNKKIIWENSKILHKRLKDDIIVDNCRNNEVKC